jgi:hypothetical protein
MEQLPSKYEIHDYQQKDLTAVQIRIIGGASCYITNLLSAVPYLASYNICS